MVKLTDFRLLAFDVYGTLIDWESGVLTGLKPLLSQTQLTDLRALDLYHNLEKEQQTETPDMPYSKLLTIIYLKFAKQCDLEPPMSQEAQVFGQSVGKWPAFPDTVDALRRLSKQFKLIVLSNVDRQSFEASNKGPLGGVSFDKIITAQDVGTYKPALRNFEYMLKAVREDFGIEKGAILQTAQSQFHDHHPARKVGIKSVWIERGGTMGNREEEIYDWKFTTLGDMADAVERELGSDGKVG